ncbi:MAG: hypothetical protein KBS63_06250 [Clostridiales bacterium]|nr:hypothetical protein [Candidatus Crickella caballi]
MSNLLRKISIMLLSLIVMATYIPVEVLATEGPAEVEQTEVSERSETSAEETEAEEDTFSDEDTVFEEVTGIENGNEEENNALLQEESEEAVSVVASEDIEGGAIAELSYSEGTISGKAVADENHELATVRLMWKNGSKDEEQYVSYNEEGSFAINDLPENVTEFTVTAYFMSTVEWDGSVDISWYDPEKTCFEIGTPAQLAGLAAIVNGMVDENETEEFQIKDNEGRAEENGQYSHRYIQTEAHIADLLTPNSGAQVRDTVWRLPSVTKEVSIAEDDIHHDMLYRTVKLTADIDMGNKNWTPIGGKYAMNPKSMNGKEARVIDTRFQGIFDGQGHTVTINADRKAALGFGYAMEIALIGYLGGGVDYKNGYPKDVYMDYAQTWVPTVRNVVVKGNVEGRRMVAGVVGRIGETNYGVLVENCANYANVFATDMRGCAGIVGAAWGKSVIRNCYNAGKIQSNFWEHGGICGSNGYEGSEGRNAVAADIYNCYNVGDTGLCDNDGLKYDGQDIGVDGQAFAAYKVADCYYIEPEAAIEKSGYNKGEINVNKKARITNVAAKTDVYMKSSEFISELNKYGKVFCTDDHNINGGYPVLWFQDHSAGDEANISINECEHGTVSASKTESIKYGSTVEFTVSPDNGYHLASLEFSEDGGETTSETLGYFYTVCGKNVTVTAEFEPNMPAELVFPEENDGEDYYVTVKKYDESSSKWVSLNSGDSIAKEEKIRIIAKLKDERTGTEGNIEPVQPDIKTLEYTGEFGDPIFTENSLELIDRISKEYKSTGESELIEISFKPKTQGKRWTTYADTSWYKEGTRSYSISSAQQLAGIAELCLEGETDFAGVNFELANDISLANTTANSGDIYGNERSWIGIGTDAFPFKGTFDGKGHTIEHMHRNFETGYSYGSNGGLFGVTEGAVIRNVNVVSGSYVNTASGGESELKCAFKNGANGGAIVGDAIDTTIENCVADVPMEEARDAGGIVGTAEGITAIRNCTNKGDITATNKNVGGIVGKVSGNKGVKIEYCVNEGNIISSSYYVGGILGTAGSYTVTISKCANRAALSSAVNSAYNNTFCIGGILGYTAGAATVDSCVNNGAVSALKNTFAIGGIVGSALSSSAVISNCYNTGEICSESAKDKATVSGIANKDSSSSKSATVKYCYNIGKITLGDGFVSTNVGGVIGFGYNSNISSTYCSESSVAGLTTVDEGRSKAGVAGSVVPDSTLKSYSISSSFGKDGYSINEGYPILKWQCDHMYVHKKIAAKVGIAGSEYDECSKCNDIKNKTTIKALNPDKTYITGLTALKRGFKVKWAKKSYTGYQIRYSLKSSMSSAKTVTVTTPSTTYKSIKKLKARKRYYVQVRTYKTVSGNKYYSLWSSKKSVKTK